MTGDFKITSQFLYKHGALSDLCWLVDTTFPDGAGYQEVIDRLVDLQNVDYAEWMLYNLGPTDDVRRYDAMVNDREKVIIFAGNLEFKDVFAKKIICGASIEADGSVMATDLIKSGNGIRARDSIISDTSIVSEGEIKAGESVIAVGAIGSEMNVNAGLNIEAGCSIRAGLGIQAGKNIKAGTCIEAGRGIKAGCGIKAGEDIKAGGDIKAGLGIRAGHRIQTAEHICSGGLIEAGDTVTPSEWTRLAIVSAAEKPKNLASGFWMEMEV